MKITSADFIKSAPDETHYPPEDTAEIAFLGRSNVGKSSLINSLLNRKGLARTSNTPGRTQLLNFFIINNSFRFVDLPGYGYARVPRTLREEWGKMAGDYLANRRALVLSIHIVDSRHDPTRQDMELQEWLRFYGKPFVTVATKADKLSRNELQKNIGRLRKAIEANAEKTDATQIQQSEFIAYSAVTGLNRDVIWHRIAEALATSHFRHENIVANRSQA